MEDEIIPFQASKGMMICGSFVGEEEDNLYVWIRRFDNEEERKRLYQEVYESDVWKNVMGPRVKELLEVDEIVVTRLEATSKSMMQ